jgi:hypothetical protein
VRPLRAGGVRSTAGNQPTLSKRELKQRIKARRDEDKALARHERQIDPIPPIENPFTPGWALAEEETSFAASASLPPPPPPPGIDDLEPAPIHERADEAHAPTLADLLPGMRTHDEAPARALASLPTREQQLGWDQQGDPEEPDRSRRGILRRRDAEPDDGREASEMIAWLDEVFTPRE